MVDQAGDVTNYLYNAVGQLAGLTDRNNNPIVTYSYNNVGELIEVADGVSGGPYTTYQYDAVGDVTSIVNYAGNGSVNSSFQYTYNVLGQIATMITLDGTWTYSYDTTGQSVHAVFASTNNSIPSQDLTYQYNAAGDRTETIVDGVTTNYTTNSVNETTSTSDGTIYTYDADGNLISETNASGTTTYTYDSLDRLISVTSPTDSFIYEYDALGNLAATIHNGQTTQNLVDPVGFDGLPEVAQYDGNSNLIAGYTYGLGLVSQFTVSATNYYQFDAQGSTADLTNSSGAIQNSYSYLPFGGTLASSGSTYNPFTFVGQDGVSTDGSGLVNMQARDYDPVVGQFVSNDPTGLAGGDSNLRRYVGNDPLDFVDPGGTNSYEVNLGGGVTNSGQSSQTAQHQQNVSDARVQLNNGVITKYEVDAQSSSSADIGTPGYTEYKNENLFASPGYYRGLLNKDVDNAEAAAYTKAEMTMTTTSIARPSKTRPCAIRTHCPLAARRPATGPQRLPRLLIRTRSSAQTVSAARTSSPKQRSSPTRSTSKTTLRPRPRPRR